MIHSLPITSQTDVMHLQLVEVINEDYGEYVSLSSRLVNVEGFVLRMRKPLVELKVCCGRSGKGIPYLNTDLGHFIL